MFYCNLTKSGRLTVAAILLQQYSNVLQPICNIAIFQRNYSAMCLQPICAVWEAKRINIVVTDRGRDRASEIRAGYLLESARRNAIFHRRSLGCA